MRNRGIQIFVLLCVLCAGALPLFSEEAYIRYDISLKELNNLGEEGLDELIGSETRLLLTGNITSVVMVRKRGEEIRWALELITGEWVGTRDIVPYSAQVGAVGSAWQDTFYLNPRGPRDEDGNVIIPDAYIAPNSYVMCLVRVTGYETNQDGELVIYTSLEYIREL